MAVLVNVTLKRLLALPEATFKALIAAPSKGYAVRYSWEEKTVIYSLDRVAIAKAYAKTKGYSGAIGGWIYTAEGQPLAQGWVSFFNRYYYTGIAPWLKIKRYSEGD